jgi:methylenetetrahydrofolate reductase (NADPH)
MKHSPFADQIGLKHAVVASKPRISFEFFPPKTEQMEQKLWQNIQRLMPLEPEFVSVTYGAGGSTRERTHDTVRRLVKETAVKPAAHLTCVGASRAEVDEVAQSYWDAGIRHIVALRGDAPDQKAGYQPHPEGYAYAADLVAGLKKIGDFDISVAAYPEVHPEASSAQADLDNLKRKIDAGANRAITQFFFDPDRFLAFREQAEKAGIAVPILPGIIPIGNFWTVKRFAKMCGTEVPAWLEKMFEGLEDDDRTHEMVAASIAAEICQRLRAAGVEDFHFYTLNRAGLTYALCRMLGIRESQEALAA